MSLWNSVNLCVSLCNKNTITQRNTEETQRDTEKNVSVACVCLRRSSRNIALFSFFSPLLHLSLPIIAQSRGSITGKIVDSKTGEGLPSVNVLVKGTYYGASSDVDGKFIIGKVNPGVYDISITLLGYKAVVYTGIKVEAGKPLNSTSNSKRAH